MVEDIMMRIQNGVTNLTQVMSEYGQDVYDLVSSLL